MLQAFAFLSLTLLPAVVFSHAQSSAAASAAPAAPVSSMQETVDAALLGDWTGVLTYRDFAERTPSDKRILLPTWLSVQRQPEGLRLRYVYDDGPSKTVRDESTLVLDTASASYRIVGTDAVQERYTISGLDRLKQGHGELLLTGPGMENGKPVDVRERLRLGRNLISWLRETRPAGTTEPFTFRHEYTFVRSVAPASEPGAKL